MTAALLKQAREAMQAIAAGDIPHEKKLEWMGLSEEAYYECRAEYFQEVAASKIAALDAHAALSPYDQAVQALAPYLPEGWVAQNADGGFYFHEFSVPSDIEADFWMSTGAPLALHKTLSVPLCDDWRTSIRRITHNSDGTVTVERG